MAKPVQTMFYVLRGETVTAVEDITKFAFEPDEGASVVFYLHRRKNSHVFVEVATKGASTRSRWNFTIGPAGELTFRFTPPSGESEGPGEFVACYARGQWSKVESGAIAYPEQPSES